MINFRYHVVSLVAVFLALGLGILMGSTVIDQGLVSRLESQTRTLAGNLDTVRNENGTLRSQVALWEAFGETTLTPLVKARLASRSIVVLAQDGTDQHIFDGITQVLRDAGAVNAGRVMFSPKWALKDTAAREQLAVVLGTQASGAGEMWTEAAGRIAGRLGQSKEITEPGDLLASLRDGGFISIEMEGAQAFPPAGALVIVLASGQRGGSPPSVEFFLPMLQSLVPARKTLVAEPLNSADSLADRVRGDADLRSKVSTIDDADITLGRLAMVLSLRSLVANGRATHLGARRSAAGLLPASFLS